MTRSRVALSAFAVVSFLAACNQFQNERRMDTLSAKLDRVTPAGGGTLVVRSENVTSRVGLVSLDTGARHVIELEQPVAVHAGSFSGPDARGRFAYFTHNIDLVRQTPTALSLALLGPDEKRRFEESWRTKTDRPKNATERALFAPRPTKLVVGEVGRAAERVVAEFDPADVLEKAVALAPSSGEIAYFVFDFDAQGVPAGLHAEVRGADGGAPRTFALGRPQLEVHGRFGPSLAWLADERHVVFKRDARTRTGPYELAGDWNGGKIVGGGWLLDDHVAFENSRWLPDRNDVVVCALDTRSGEVREIARALYAWPMDTGDEVLASDGSAIWIVHAATGAVEARRELPPDSPLRAPWSDSTRPRLAIVAAPARDRVFAVRRAGDEAGIARTWTTTLSTGPTEFGLALTTLDGAAPREVVPVLTSGATFFVRASLPADLPELRRSSKHDFD